jgi:hypothetical protein
MTTEAGLPPGAERDEKGQLFRMVIRSTAGKKRDVRRPVALTLEEAKEKRWDWFHPELGIWVLEGWKLEADRSQASILQDGSSAVGPSSEEVDR